MVHENKLSASSAAFRFYGALNDFLPPMRRQRTLLCFFKRPPAVKHAIEAFGVPHPEVDLILVDGRPAKFDDQLRDKDRVAVFPVFAQFDVGCLPRLRPQLAPFPRFVADVHLGKLARGLRLLGVDCLYRNDYQDRDIADISAKTGRVALTRDRRLLFSRRITYGYWVRAVEAQAQIEEVFYRYDLHRALRPFQRCLRCNGLLTPVAKADVLHRLQPRTRRYYENFYRCADCGHIYWEGSHVENMRQRFSALFRPGS